MPLVHNFTRSAQAERIASLMDECLRDYRALADTLPRHPDCYCPSCTLALQHAAMAEYFEARLEHERHA